MADVVIVVVEVEAVIVVMVVVVVVVLVDPHPPLYPHHSFAKEKKENIWTDYKWVALRNIYIATFPAKTKTKANDASNKK